MQSAQTMPVEPAANGASRTFLFGEWTVGFDSWRDSSNIGGRVYKYFVFGLTDPVTKELLDFQTNGPELVTHCKAHPEKRAGLLRLTAAAKFPAKFN